MRLRRRTSKYSRLYLSSPFKVSIYLVFTATWGSGVSWLVFHYFLARHGPFGREPNPLEAWWLTLHGACAFAMLWLGGWLWARHVMPWWNSGKRRVSGMILIAAGATLIVTGYLLYYASADRLRYWVSLFHWTVGLALLVPLLVHALRSPRYRSALHRDHAGIRRKWRAT